MPLHLCTACCLVPPARTNGAKYLRRLEPQACCARPSAGRRYDLTETGLCCYASITHAFVGHRLVSRPRRTPWPPCARCRRENGTLALPGRRSVAAQTRSQSAGNELLYANRQRFQYYGLEYPPNPSDGPLHKAERLTASIA